MAYYKDLREYINALEANNLLLRIKRQINKDTELMPLVRCQFRGLPEQARKAFFFENVVDVKGNKYPIPVTVGAHAASREIYALGMMCKADKIMERWEGALLHPIQPKIVDHGPIHEEIHVGDNLLEHGGLEEFPVPISTPGFDNAPYLTCANWVSKDPVTGVRNIGNYRGMIKSQTRTGISSPIGQDLRASWEKCKKMGKSLEAAIVIGASPVIGYVGTIKFPYDVDEYDVAGGIANEAIELVKCKTVDLEVPATAEIVIEGILPTDFMEREAPFGEYAGYMGIEMIGPYFNVTCITHRRDPIYTAFISQMPPSESSKIKSIGREAVLFKFLRSDCGLPILDVAFHEFGGGAWLYCVIKMKKSHPAQAWQALNGTLTYFTMGCKFVIVVDEDIDARDADSVNWALSFRVQPDRDVRTAPGRIFAMDHSIQPTHEIEQRYPGVTGGSALLIDATRKWDYPAVSLPKKEFMERAVKIWEEEGLPKLSLKEPWSGYSLGHWTKENEEEAELALKGEHYRTGEKLAGQRIKT